MMKFGKNKKVVSQQDEDELANKEIRSTVARASVGRGNIIPPVAPLRAPPLPPPLPPEPPSFNDSEVLRAELLQERVNLFKDNYLGVFTPAGTGFSSSECMKLDLLFAIFCEIKKLGE